MAAWQQIYLVVVGLLGAIGLLLLELRIRREAARRKDHVAGITRWEAIGTETPFDDPAGVARKRSIQNIETRFAWIQRTLVPFAVTFWLLALAIPFLGTLPGALVTVVAGSISVVVGIAAKPYVENLIAGTVLSFTQPLRLGDTVMIDGQYGTVEDIRATHTVIKVWDWRRYIVPNSQLFAKEFLNYSLNDRYQWAYVEFTVEYGADLALVERLVVEAMQDSPAFAGHEEPAVWCMGLEERGVRFWCAGWADTPSLAWSLAADCRRALATSLAEHGIRAHVHHGRLKDPPRKEIRPRWADRRRPQATRRDKIRGGRLPTGRNGACFSLIFRSMNSRN